MSLSGKPVKKLTFSESFSMWETKICVPNFADETSGLVFVSAVQHFPAQDRTDLHVQWLTARPSGIPHDCEDEHVEVSESLT